MFVKKKIIIGALALGLSSISSLAAAQIYDGATLGLQDDFGVQATVGFKIPLGATNRKKLKHQPRLDFGLDFTRTTSQNQTGQWYKKRVDLLDFGFYGTSDFSLRLSGQELYGPTYSTIYADETGDPIDTDGSSEKSSGNSAKWLIGGAVVAVVVVVGATAIVVDDIEDNLRGRGD